MVCYGHFIMDYEIKYLNCLCLKGTTVSQFITNACLQLIIVIIQLLVRVVILIEYSSLVRIITYYNLYLINIQVWLNDNSIVKKSCILLSSIANNKYDYKVYLSFRPPRPRQSCTNCIDNILNRSTIVSMNFYIIVCYRCDSIYMHTLRHESNFVYRCLIHKYLVENTNIFTYIQLILKVPQHLMYAPCLIQFAFNLMICCSNDIFNTIYVYSHIMVMDHTILLLLWCTCIFIIYTRVLAYNTILCNSLVLLCQYTCNLSWKVEWNAIVAICITNLINKNQLLKTIFLAKYYYLLFAFICNYLFIDNSLLIAARYEQLFCMHHVCTITYFITLMSSIILWELINSYNMCLHRWIFLNLSQWLI